MTPPIDGVNPTGSRSPASVTGVSQSASVDFKGLVKERVTFSRHAEQRMQERKIQLSKEEINLLHEAMGQAKSAGAHKAAVVMEPGIFIVAPGSNTVITTVPKNQEKPMQVISQVDALVLVGRTSNEGASSPRPIDGGQTQVHWSLIQKNG